MGLRTDDARPLHVQIADDIRRRITKGEYKPGQKLPSLRSLSREYEVAEPTVHNAVKELQRAGLLVSTSGRGTFVQEVTTPEQPAGSDLYAELDDIRAKMQTLDRRLTRVESTLPRAEKPEASTRRKR